MKNVILTAAVVAYSITVHAQVDGMQKLDEMPNGSRSLWIQDSAMHAGKYAQIMAAVVDNLSGSYDLIAYSANCNTQALMVAAVKHVDASGYAQVSERRGRPEVFPAGSIGDEVVHYACAH